MAKTRTRNFPDPDGPMYRAEYAAGGIGSGRDLKVVSWNIQFATEVTAAIAELNGEQELANAGILLLQEMDESGVDIIAKDLGYNYIYYPASIQRRTGREFGNAVLSRWPITGCCKVRLPHESPRSGEMRIAARADVDVDGTRLIAYSVHTETFALGPGKRREQFMALAEDVRRCGCDRVLAGGDFNTLLKSDIRSLEGVLGDAGLVRASAGSGYTLRTGFLGFSFDHIFTRGIVVAGNGTSVRTRASDHLPVWLRLTLD